MTSSYTMHLGESIDKIDKLPQTELLKDKGYEILYMTDDIDEFAVQILHEFDGKEFKSVSAEDLEIEETAEEKEKAEKQAEESKDMLEAMKDALDGKVAEVRLSQRLKSHPVCLTTKGGSFHRDGKGAQRYTYGSEGQVGESTGDQRRTPCSGNAEEIIRSGQGQHKDVRRTPLQPGAPDRGPAGRRSGGIFKFDLRTDDKIVPLWYNSTCMEKTPCRFFYSIGNFS